MKIFITGASGFIGGAIAKRLAKDHWVLGLARSKEAYEKVKALGVRPLTGSLETMGAGMLKECDLVIHCAAYVKPWGSYQDFAEVNVEGTKHLLALAKKAGVKRFIHMGTEAALFYGQDMNDIDEGYPYPDHSHFPYSETKKLAEIAVLKANEPGVFETISLRPRLVWGPGDETILPNLIQMVDEGKFRWIGEGNFTTSTTYIDNLVDATLLAMEKGKAGEAYFITDWEIHSMRDFLTQLLATEGRDPGNRNVPKWVARFLAQVFEAVYKLFRIRRKPPITRFSAAIMSSNCTISSDRAQLDLGYEPKVSVAEGMQRMSKVPNFMQRQDEDHEAYTIV